MPPLPSPSCLPTESRMGLFGLFCGFCPLLIATTDQVLFNGCSVAQGMDGGFLLIEFRLMQGSWTRPRLVIRYEVDRSETVV